MADETILIDIEYDTGEAEKEVDSLTESIEGLKVAQAQLKEEVKTGTKTQTEASKENAKIQVQLQKEQKGRKDLIKIMQSEKGSRDQLRQSISELIRKRNALNTSTKQGQKESKNLEKQINKLDKAYQKSGTASEKAKGNIGKYGNAMSGLPGPISGVISSMKVLAKVIFATPLGWLIGLITGAAAALKTFFTGSAEGQERWNKTMNKAKAIISVFKDELIKIGKAISNFTDNLKLSEGGISGWASSVKDKAQGAWANLKKDVSEKGLWGTLKENATDAVDSLKNKFDELGAAIDENVARGDAIAEKENALRRSEIESLTQVATLRRDIAEARAQASDKEGTTAKQRLSFLDSAIEKENNILAIEENLAATRVNIQKLQMAQGENTLEDYEQLATLEKAQIDLETSNAMARRKIQSERQTALREAAAEEKALTDEKFLTDQELFDFENQLELERVAEQNELLIELDGQYNTTLIEANAAMEEAKTAKTAEQEANRRALVSQSLSAVSSLAGQANDFIQSSNQNRLNNELAALDRKQQTELLMAGEDAAKKAKIEAEYNKKKEALEKKAAKKAKRLAITMAIIRGALVILNALNTVPFFPVGVIAAAAAAITTGIQVAKIKNSPMAKGGKVPLAKRGANFGTFDGPSHSGGGIDLFTGSGKHVANVEGKENFYVINKKASAHINSLSDINQRIGGGVPLSNTRTKMADGGRAEVEATQQGININDITREVVSRLPPIIVRTEDIKTGVENYDNVVNVGVV